MTDEQKALMARLRKAANLAAGRNPDEYGAWMTVTDFQATLAQIEALLFETAWMRHVLQQNLTAWENCLELQLLPPQHRDTAKEMVIRITTTLAQETQS